MLLTTPIRNLGEIKYIDRFEDLCALATTMKTQRYFLDPNTNRIFGFYLDYHSIIEISIPFRINVPLLFDGSILTPKTKDLIHNTECFFYSTANPYILFPISRRGDFINENLVFTFGDKENKFGVIDKITGRYADDCIVLINPDLWYTADNYKSVLYAYYKRLPYLGIPQLYKNYEQNLVVKQVSDEKVSQGAKVDTIRMVGSENRYKTYSFYLFKSLINSYTKSDTIDLYIQDDLIAPNKFMATFRVIKKNKLKNKIPELTDFYNIDTHVFMFNLA